MKDAKVDVIVDNPLSREIDFVTFSDKVALGEELIEACVGVVSKSGGKADDVLSDNASLVEVMFMLVLDVVFSIFNKDSSVTGLWEFGIVTVELDIILKVENGSNVDTFPILVGSSVWRESRTLGPTSEAFADWIGRTALSADVLDLNVVDSDVDVTSGFTSFGVSKASDCIVLEFLLLPTI